MSSPPNDKPLSHVYREGAWPEPNQQIEQAIRATERGRRSFARRWAVPFALVVAALLVLTLIIRSGDQQPRPTAGSPPPSGSSKVEQSQATPDAQKPAVEPDAQKAAVEPDTQKAAVKPAQQKVLVKSQSATAAPPPPVTPPYATRKDEAERRGLLPPDTGIKASPPVKESAKPPPAPKAALNKEPPPERVPDPQTFVPTRSPEAWIEDIRKLKADGKTDEAARELAEFRARYADYVLPEDLR